jgi:hypothetical protein
MKHYAVSISILIQNEYVKNSVVIIEGANNSIEAQKVALYGEAHNQEDMEWIDRETVKEEIFLYEVDDVVEVPEEDLKVLEKYFNFYTVNELMPSIH